MKTVKGFIDNEIENTTEVLEKSWNTIKTNLRDVDEDRVIGKKENRGLRDTLDEMITAAAALKAVLIVAEKEEVDI